MHEICCNIKPGAALSPLQILCPECTPTEDFVMYVTEVQRGLFNHSYYTKHGYLTVTKNA